MEHETAGERNEERQARRERMRAESEALAKDPEYLAEIRRVQEDCEPYRSW